MHNTRFAAIMGSLILILCFSCQASGSSATGYNGLMAPIPPQKTSTPTPAMKEAIVKAAQVYNYRSLLDHWQIELTPEQEAFLDENRFLLIEVDRTSFRDRFTSTGPGHNGIDPDSPDDLLKSYQDIGGSDLNVRWPYQTRLVTPDVVLHAFFRYLQNSLEYVETSSLAPQLLELLSSMIEAAQRGRETASDALKPRWELVIAQLAVAKVLIENNGDNDNLEQALSLLEKQARALPEDLVVAGRQELELIYQAEKNHPSPLFSRYIEGRSLHDYSMYTPRSHYTKNGTLRAYFRTMTYLGRQYYPLNSESGIADAILVTSLIMDNGERFEAWKRILAVTAFYAGQPDDITTTEFERFIKTSTGGSNLTPETAADSAALQELVVKAKTDLPAPKILSEVVFDFDVLRSKKAKLREKTKSFRIFGQRFNLDGWIMGQLTKGSTTDEILLPRTPSALFLPAVYGDPLARELCGQFVLSLGKDIKEPAQLSDFYDIMDKLRKHVANLPDEQNFSSLGAAWLYVLSTLTGEYGTGYPIYMQSRAYPLKQIQTFLGSYTEYKHAFQLYQKQLMTEKGAPGPPEQPPVPRGFVTPNLRFWNAFLRVLHYTRDGFQSMGLSALENWPEGRLNQFMKCIGFYAYIAEKELTSTTILDPEYERLRVLNFGYMAKPFNPMNTPTTEDYRSPVVADIATVISEDEAETRIVYEATGKPYVMLALVGNEEMPRLAIGFAYNHFEFRMPFVGRRYTKKDWHWKVYQAPEMLPKKNFWYEPLLVR